MSYISNGFINFTSSEIDALTNLTDLAPSGVGEFLRKTGYYTFENVTFSEIGLGTVTSVAALTLGTTGTDLSSTVATGTTTPVITLQVPTASASNRGALSSTDWSTFNGKQSALTFGIADTNKVQINAADVADNDYAKFTATGLEGRSYAEVLSDIAAAPIASPNLTGTPAAPTANPGTSTTQLATTEFVQVAVRSTPGKEASEYATIAALPTVVYANGSSGVGATLTGVAFGAIGVDSQSPVVGNRILVKNQVSTFQNGIYIVTIVGTAGTVFVLTRTADFNEQTDILTGASTYVVGGTTLAGTTWDVNSADSPVIGTDAITFIQSAGPGSVVQGNGITITGTSIAINTAVTADLSTAQTMTNKTIDGVTPTTMGYVDPTSSIQTQLNGKQASGAYLTTVDISANTNLAVTAPVVLTGDTLSIPAATASVNGYATSTQITKLDGIATAATANTKASGAEVDTGTDDTKFVTSKAMEDSAYIKSGVALPLAGGTMTGPIVQGSYVNLSLPASDHTAVGTATNALQSGATVAQSNLVFLGTGGKWLLVDADAIATCKGLLGIAMEAKNDTQAMLVALPGSFVRDDTWNWTIGDILYAGETAGGIQNTIPTGADGVVKPIGVAIDVGTIFFFPSPHTSTVVA